MSLPSKDLIKAGIVAQIHQQSVALLVDALTDAQARIAELEAKLPKDEAKAE